MAFGDIGAKFKQKAGERDAANAPPPTDYVELHMLRSRILGVLIRDARQMKGLSEQECAVEIGIPMEYFIDWELGKRSPTLPQLEILAYFIGVPVSHFWNTTTISAPEDRDVPKEAFNDLRDRVIGTLIRIKRTELDMSEDDLAAACGLSTADIDAYELADRPIPFSELTSIASALRVPLSFFMDDSSRVGTWLNDQEAYRKFSELPEPMKAWLLQPAHQAYIEIAMKLSKLPVHELREVGENILNITF